MSPISAFQPRKPQTAETKGGNSIGSAIDRVYTSSAVEIANRWGELGRFASLKIESSLVLVFSIFPKFRVIATWGATPPSRSTLRVRESLWTGQSM